MQGTAPLADDLATLGAVEEAHFAAWAAEQDINPAAAVYVGLAPGVERDTATAEFFASIAGEVVHDTEASAGSSLKTVPGLYAMVAEYYAAVSRLCPRVLSKHCVRYRTDSHFASRRLERAKTL